MIDAAGMLPRVANSVPIETKLGQGAGDGHGLLVFKLNPDPLTDNLRRFMERWGIAFKQRQ